MNDKLDLEEVRKFIFDDEETCRSKYERLVSGEYGAFEIYDVHGEVSGYRGFRKYYGTTGIFSTYREAIEAALEEFKDE